LPFEIAAASPQFQRRVAMTDASRLPIPFLLPTPPLLFAFSGDRLHLFFPSVNYTTLSSFPRRTSLFFSKNWWPRTLILLPKAVGSLRRSPSFSFTSNLRPRRPGPQMPSPPRGASPPASKQAGEPCLFPVAGGSVLRKHGRACPDIDSIS